MNKVFVPQEPTRFNQTTGTTEPLYDFTAALRYGDLRICLPPNINFHMTSPVAIALREKLKDFVETDYLIAVGSPLVIGLSTHIALLRTGGKLNLLSWDRREKEYINSRIEL